MKEGVWLQYGIYPALSIDRRQKGGVSMLRTPAPAHLAATIAGAPPVVSDKLLASSVEKVVGPSIRRLKLMCDA